MKRFFITIFVLLLIITVNLHGNISRSSVPKSLPADTLMYMYASDFNGLYKSLWKSKFFDNKLLVKMKKEFEKEFSKVVKKLSKEIQTDINFSLDNLPDLLKELHFGLLDLDLKKEKVDFFVALKINTNFDFLETIYELMKKELKTDENGLLILEKSRKMSIYLAINEDNIIIGTNPKIIASLVNSYSIKNSLNNYSYYKKVKDKYKKKPLYVYINPAKLIKKAISAIPSLMFQVGRKSRMGMQQMMMMQSISMMMNMFDFSNLKSAGFSTKWKNPSMLSHVFFGNNDKSKNMFNLGSTVGKSLKYVPKKAHSLITISLKNIKKIYTNMINKIKNLKNPMIKKLLEMEQAAKQLRMIESVLNVIGDDATIFSSGETKGDFGAVLHLKKDANIYLIVKKLLGIRGNLRLVYKYQRDYRIYEIKIPRMAYFHLTKVDDYFIVGSSRTTVIRAIKAGKFDESINKNRKKLKIPKKFTTYINLSLKDLMYVLEFKDIYKMMKKGARLIEYDVMKKDYSYSKANIGLNDLFHVMYLFLAVKEGPFIKKKHDMRDYPKEYRKYKKYRKTPRKYYRKKDFY